jgi:regulator of sigma E protease
LFAPVWDWQSFWTLTAFLSIILGVINVLPIPALDGGHVMFVLYEIISGRKPSDKFLEYAQIVGFVILLALMAYALRNDFVNYF